MKRTGNASRPTRHPELPAFRRETALWRVRTKAPSHLYVPKTAGYHSDSSAGQYHLLNQPFLSFSSVFLPLIKDFLLILEHKLQIQIHIITNQKPKQVILDGFKVIFYEPLADVNECDIITHSMGFYKTGGCLRFYK